MLPLPFIAALLTVDARGQEIDVVDLPLDLTIPLEPVCPDAAWPEPDFDDRVLEAASRRPGVVQALDAYLFDSRVDHADPDRRGIRTDGFVVVHSGHIVYERYRAPYDAETPHLSWSVSKAVMTTLAGIAVKEGRLDLTDSICDHLRPTHSVPDANCSVTVQHLLEMSSGFDWNEAVRGTTARSSSVLAMLYGVGAADMATFAVNHPLAKPPGTSWRYSSGDSMALSAVVGAALSPSHGEDFPFTTLLTPLGIDGATWERDAAGTYVGASHLWITPRDMARYGFLMLQEGCWNGLPLLPKDWMARSTTVSEPVRNDPVGLNGVQGWGLWLNVALPERGMAEPTWPSAPADLFVAEGNLGQTISVVPSANLVVVRTADDRDDSFDLAVAVNLALDLVEGR